MVITITWLESGASLIITISTLLLVAFLLVFCVCFGQNKRSNKFYAVDGIKQNKAPSHNLNIFRRFSGTKETENIFTSSNLPLCSNQIEDSFEKEIAKSLDALILKLDDECPHSRDEVKSCLSNESLNSFYSAHPSTVTRCNSKNSFVSLISEFED